MSFMEHVSCIGDETYIQILSEKPKGMPVRTEFNWLRM